MNTNRIAPIVGAAAVLLALSACAGVDGQFADEARAVSAQARLEARVPSDRMQALTLEETAVREALEARAGGGNVQERIRATKQAESGPSQSPSPSMQELIRSVKQAESEQ